jgi:cytochrome c oxidase cbb3-type subunit III
MAEGLFVSGFWTWFITLGTVFGIAFCFALIWWLGGELKKTGVDVEDTGHVWDEDLRELNNPLPRWWLGMFYITLVFGIIYLIAYPGFGAFAGVLGWSQEQQYNDEVAEANERYGPIFDKFSQTSIEDLGQVSEAMRTGERLYASYCTTCHGSDARGVRGFPNLRDKDWLWGGTPEAIKTTILDGRQAGMPAWREILGDEKIENVANYILSLNPVGRKFDREAADAGKAVFATNCAACHMPDGTGNQALGAPNLADNIWLYGGSRRSIEATIAEGRQGRMPPHRDFLGEAKVHLLAAYVYHLEP